MASIIDLTRRMEINNENWKVSRFASLYEQPSADHPEGGGRIYLPPHQRDWSWIGANGLKKMRKFIDTVLHNYPVPTIILNRFDDDVRDRWQVYDGRHRIETLWRFVNNKFGIKNGEAEVYYRDLCPSDRRHFDDRFLAVEVTDKASFVQLADVFIRLNSGKALTNADYCHASRDSPLIRGTIEHLTPYKERLRALFGGNDILAKKSLPHWIGIVLGLTLNVPGNMTTSFIRIQEHLDLAVNGAAVATAMDALVDLYTRANTAFVLPEKGLSRYSHIGFINAFFIADWMSVPAESTVENWLRVILHIRKEDDDRIVHISGAQNLNDKKIQLVHDNVHTWLSKGVVAAPPLPVDSESEDYDEDDA